MPTINCQTARSSNGTYHIYTTDVSPYSIYLPRPLEHYLPALKGTIKQGYRSLKTPKYLTHDEMVVGLQSVTQAYGGGMTHLIDTYIFATHYPPGLGLDFYKSVNRFMNVYRDTYPLYEDILHYLSVDNMVHLLKSLYDTNTTWGTAKTKLNTFGRHDFSRGFYRPEHVKLYDLTDPCLDQFPVLLIVAWSDLLTYRDQWRETNLAIEACLLADFPSSLDYINTNLEARKLVLGFPFSGDNVYDYVRYRNYEPMEALYHYIARNCQ